MTVEDVGNLKDSLTCFGHLSRRPLRVLNRSVFANGAPSRGRLTRFAAKRVSKALPFT